MQIRVQEGGLGLYIAHGSSSSKPDPIGPHFWPTLNTKRQISRSIFWPTLVWDRIGLRSVLCFRLKNKFFF